MKTHKIIPIIIILCLSAQGAVPALAVCDNPCCSANKADGENHEIPHKASVKPNQCCHSAEEFQDKAPKELTPKHPGNSSFIPISLSHDLNHPAGNRNSLFSTSSCHCVEDKSDSSSGEKAVSAHYARLDKRQTLFVFLPDSPGGNVTSIRRDAFLTVNSQLTATGKPTPLYLISLSLLI